MYDVTPKAVYVHESVLKNRKATDRMERMLNAMGIQRDDVATVDAHNIHEIAAIAEQQKSLRNGRRKAGTAACVRDT